MIIISLLIRYQLVAQILDQERLQLPVLLRLCVNKSIMVDLVDLLSTVNHASQASQASQGNLANLGKLVNQAHRDLSGYIAS